MIRHVTWLMLAAALSMAPLMGCSDDGGGGEVSVPDAGTDTANTDDTSGQTSDTGITTEDATNADGSGGNEDASTDTSVDAEPDAPPTLGDPQPWAGPSGGGSSALSSERYNMRLSIGGPAPMGQTESTQYRARIGVGAPQQ